MSLSKIKTLLIAIICFQAIPSMAATQYPVFRSMNVNEINLEQIQGTIIRSFSIRNGIIYDDPILKTPMLLRIEHGVQMSFLFDASTPLKYNEAKKSFIAESQMPIDCNINGIWVKKNLKATIELKFPKLKTDQRFQLLDENQVIITRPETDGVWSLSSYCETEEPKTATTTHSLSKTIGIFVWNVDQDW